MPMANINDFLPDRQRGWMDFIIKVTRFWSLAKHLMVCGFTVITLTTKDMNRNGIWPHAVKEGCVLVL